MIPLNLREGCGLKNDPKSGKSPNSKFGLFDKRRGGVHQVFRKCRLFREETRL